jgi:hypothetical protein
VHLLGGRIFRPLTGKDEAAADNVTRPRNGADGSLGGFWVMTSAPAGFTWRSMAAAARPKRGQVPPLHLTRRAEAEPGRQPLPPLGAQRHGRVPPEMLPDLGRHLEDDKLVRPGGEAALAPELPKVRPAASAL